MYVCFTFIFIVYYVLLPSAVIKDDTRPIRYTFFYLTIIGVDSVSSVFLCFCGLCLHRMVKQSLLFHEISRKFSSPDCI